MPLELRIILSVFLLVAVALRVVDRYWPHISPPIKASKRTWVFVLVAVVAAGLLSGAYFGYKDATATRQSQGR